mmetsp:Transcript_103627/g.269932  ORF Transcript_103627/g.269932 Transcript_103627/m.269932 type:complete len:622 (-) Transcript_103627:98-1963(-)
MAEKPKDDAMYRFYQANIHERRFAARVARGVPMGTIMLTTVLVLFGVFYSVALLLWLCAVFNVCMWLWIVSAAMFGILGVDKVYKELEREADVSKAPATASTAPGQANPQAADDMRQVTHTIVFPNYKEDEAMLADTLQSLAEALGSEGFVVVLAMEEREGPEARAKAERLEGRFASSFAALFASYHPAGELEAHLDGSSDEEVPGKASNLKWAVQKAYEHCEQEPSIQVEQVLLTVADADVFFHPSYFRRIEHEYMLMKESPGEQHKWTMWQAPQLPYRNYFISPAPSRVWGYISSIYEFGGVASLSSGGHHMVFSAYSTSMQLAHDAGMWDGDIIAEDHHAYVKTFFYSVYCSAEAQLMPGKAEASGLGCRAALRVRPIMLPVKSTSVASAEGLWASYVERWHQATRHCQGVAELSYSLLVCWDMICTLPLSMYNVHFVMQLIKVMVRPFFMHIVPICQAIALGALTVYWVWNKRSVPTCPDRIWMASSDGETLLCGLAGAWALTWPVMIPFTMVAFANYRFIRSSFLEPSWAHPGASLWHMCDGGIPATWGSQVFTVVYTILFDALVLMAPLMVPYGLLAEVCGCWNVWWKGNHFNYVTAAKSIGGPATDYGTMRANP